MAVTAKFVPDQIATPPGLTTTVVLRLYNDDDEPRRVALTTSGDLRDHVRLGDSTVTLETNQIVDVSVTVDVPPSIEAGTHSFTVEGVLENTGPEDAATVTATASLDVGAHTDFSVELTPPHSRGSSSGRHLVKVANSGNTPVVLALTVGPLEPRGLQVKLLNDSLAVAPGMVAEAAVRVMADNAYWSGPKRSFEFTVIAAAADGHSEELAGTFEQRPRVPGWLGPATAGAFAALLIGAIAWFALLKPWVQDTADDSAASAIERDRVALQERIDELEEAAAEAEELPLGSPIDFRLDVEPSGGNTEQATTLAETGTVISITDVVFQNPTGAVGTVSLRRGDDILLQSELANFRDYDLHFVAPFQFDDNAEIVLEVQCRTPGVDASTCRVGALLVGFVDDVG